MDIRSLYNVNSGVVEEHLRALKAAGETQTNVGGTEGFSGILDAAMENIKTTNAYISEKENEELKFALGQTENTHDLLIAQQKAATALQYTVALRDKFLESYKELMNMQI